MGKTGVSDGYLYVQTAVVYFEMLYIVPRISQY